MSGGSVKLMLVVELWVPAAADTFMIFIAKLCNIRKHTQGKNRKPYFSVKIKKIELVIRLFPDHYYHNIIVETASMKHLIIFSDRMGEIIVSPYSLDEFDAILRGMQEPALPYTLRLR